MPAIKSKTDIQAKYIHVKIGNEHRLNKKLNIIYRIEYKTYLPFNSMRRKGFDGFFSQQGVILNYNYLNTVLESKFDADKTQSLFMSKHLILLLLCFLSLNLLTKKDTSRFSRYGVCLVGGKDLTSKVYDLN